MNPSVINLTHAYPVSARKVWDGTIDQDALREVNAPRLRFSGLPQGLLTPLFSAWARYLYKACHPALLKVLSDAEKTEEKHI